MAMSSSEAYLQALPLFSNNQVELYDENGRLRSQFLSLLRKTGSAGKDSVIVSAGVTGHSDMANAVVLALNQAAGRLYDSGDRRRVEVYFNSREDDKDAFLKPPKNGQDVYRYSRFERIN